MDKSYFIADTINNTIHGPNKVMLMSNHKVIPFNKVSPYKFHVGFCRYEKEVSDNSKEKLTYVLIFVEYKKNGITLRLIHPVSEYLLKLSNGRKRLKLNTVRAKAMYIVCFLNYILIENGEKLNVRDIYDLKFEHAELYLNYYSTTAVGKSTVVACDRVLVYFYYYLAEKGVLLNHTVQDFIVNKNNEGRITSIESPFDNVWYPQQEKSTNLLHDIPNELVIPFIDTALDIAPKIALGVYFQFFGGLRVGEIVGIKKSNVTLKGHSGEYGILLNLKSNNLRYDLKHRTNGGTPKKSRKQYVFPYKGNILPRLYKIHITSFSQKGPLFINQQGKAMTDDLYRYYFNKVKVEFCKRLLNSDDAKYRNYGLYLQSKKWSTHLGRGIFSNMIAEISPNLAHLRQSRGDSTFDAAFAYIIESTTLSDKIIENQLEMWEQLGEKTKKFLDDNED